MHNRFLGAESQYWLYAGQICLDSGMVRPNLDGTTMPILAGCAILYFRKIYLLSATRREQELSIATLEGPIATGAT